MTPAEELRAAEANLAQARRFTPRTEQRKIYATTLSQLEAEVARCRALVRAEHPSSQDPEPAA